MSIRPSEAPPSRPLEAGQEPDDVPALREFYVYVAGACNLACRHCWIDPHHEQKTQRYLPLDELMKIVEQARPLGLAGVKLTGGEPLLHPQAVEMVSAIAEAGLQLRMETNGTLIDEPVAQALAAAKARVSVSLDGPTAKVHDALRGGRDAFDRAVSGIKRLRAAAASFQTVFALHRANAPHLLDTVRLCHELGAVTIKVNPISAVSRSEAMKDRGELLSVAEVLALRQEVLEQTAELDDFWVDFDVPPAFKSLKTIAERGPGTCGIRNILGVLHDGHGALCGVGEHVKAFDFGRLVEQGVEQVWRHNPLLNELRRAVPDRLGGVCGNCMMRQYCLGKCIAHAYMQTGEMFGGFPFCQRALDQGLFPETRLVDPTLRL